MALMRLNIAKNWGEDQIDGLHVFQTTYVYGTGYQQTGCWLIPQSYPKSASAPGYRGRYHYKSETGLAPLCQHE